jgi:hypothetical protein
MDRWMDGQKNKCGVSISTDVLLEGTHRSQGEATRCHEPQVKQLPQCLSLFFDMGPLVSKLDSREPIFRDNTMFLTPQWPPFSSKYFSLIQIYCLH